MRSALIFILAFSSVAAAPQQSRTPPPQGSDISARDGDRILVEDDARVQILRRRQATVRAVFSEKERLLIVLVDYSKPGEFPDGMVDWAFNFYEVEGAWPMGSRWEGLTTIFQYEGNQSRPRGLSVETPQGLVQLLPRSVEPAATDPRARLVLSHGAFSSGPRQRLSFAETEAIQLADAARTKASGATISTAMPSADSGATGLGVASVAATIGTMAAGDNRESNPALPTRPVAPPNLSYFPPVPVRPPPPPGQDIPANDGDRVVVEDDARIQVIRRRQATIRAIFINEWRALVVLADYAKPGQYPDGTVDSMFTFRDLQGQWPIESRWEALTTMFQYEGDQQLPIGYGLLTPAGLVHLLPGRPGLQKPEPTAAAVLWFRGSTIGQDRKMSFEEAEKNQLSEASRQVPTAR